MSKAGEEWPQKQFVYLGVDSSGRLRMQGPQVGSGWRVQNNFKAKADTAGQLLPFPAPLPKFQCHPSELELPLMWQALSLKWHGVLGYLYIDFKWWSSLDLLKVALIGMVASWHARQAEGCCRVGATTESNSQGNAQNSHGDEATGM